MTAASTEVVGAARPGILARVGQWWFAPLPRGRIAALRTAVYGFVLLDVFYFRPWVIEHGNVPGELYKPLFIGRILPLPTPTPLVVRVVQVALVVTAIAALTKWFPRVIGFAVFALYLEWMVIAFSYGKVDHDRLAFLVALAVLPTAGPARWGDRTPDPAAGWALRCIQVAVVFTYFGSVFAKLRFGGVNWPTGSTLMRAVIRRGTWLTDPLVNHPAVLKAAQFVLMAFETASPLLLVGGWIGRAMLITAVTFHLVTFAGIEIMFWPHVLCLLAFVPLERLDPRAWRSKMTAATAQPSRT